MKLPKTRRSSSVLGLNLSDGQLRAGHAVRTKNGIVIDKVVAAPLTLDVSHPAAELVGREIKNILDAAGIRERRCIVTIPARWVMSQQTKLPDLSPEDAASFLQLEAEKGLPVDPAQLLIVPSYQRLAGATYVTQLAVRREQLGQLVAVLKAAGLRPVSFTLGLPELPGAVGAADRARVTVALAPDGVSLMIGAGGGIAALRTFEAGIESEAGELLINAGAVSRELRITLEQMPAEIRPLLREVALTGDPALVRQVADALRDWARSNGVALQRADAPEKTLGAELAERVAIQWLEHGASLLEFLPPNPSRWTVLLSRYSSKRFASVGFVVGAVAVLALLAFGWQEWRRWSLRSEWHAMQPQVAALDSVQAHIRDYRPFYDESYRTLTIMEKVSECFPDNGSVTAKTFELHGAGTVSISGSARDNASLLRTHDQLRKMRQVQGLKVEQIRGKIPVQFTFTFHWLTSSGT